MDDQFDHALIEDRNQVDLLIVIGTSLKVSPVAEIICKDSYIKRKYNLIPRDLDHIPHSVPQVGSWSSTDDKEDEDNIILDID